MKIFAYNRPPSGQGYVCWDAGTYSNMSTAQVERLLHDVQAELEEHYRPRGYVPRAFLVLSDLGKAPTQTPTEFTHTRA